MFFLEQRVQECVQEDVDLDFHEFSEPRHSVVDFQTRQVAKQSHACCAGPHTFLIGGQNSRLCGRALNVIFELARPGKNSQE